MLDYLCQGRTVSKRRDLLNLRIIKKISYKVKGRETSLPPFAKIKRRILLIGTVPIVASNQISIASIMYTLNIA